jgi:hypothetical protein
MKVQLVGLRLGLHMVLGLDSTSDSLGSIEL